MDSHNPQPRNQATFTPIPRRVGKFLELFDRVGRKIAVNIERLDRIERWVDGDTGDLRGTSLLVGDDWIETHASMEDIVYILTEEVRHG